MTDTSTAPRLGLYRLAEENGGGYVKRGADLLFQVVAARYEAGSIVLTTNRAFREWGTLFDVGNTLATALIDRLMHHGEALLIKGDSYRLKDKGDDPPSAGRSTTLRPWRPGVPRPESLTSCVVTKVQPTHEQPTLPRMGLVRPIGSLRSQAPRP